MTNACRSKLFEVTIFSLNDKLKILSRSKVLDFIKELSLDISSWPLQAFVIATLENSFEGSTFRRMRTFHCSNYYNEKFAYTTLDTLYNRVFQWCCLSCHGI